MTDVSAAVGDTKSRILDTMQALIQTRGYSAVSYQDIADQLGIRKASIHYHFATKNELGVAVVARYGRIFEGILATATEQRAGCWQLLDLFIQPFMQFSETGDRICLCGALAGEFLALPKDMQRVVGLFFETQQSWLETLLRDGRKSGKFAFTGSPRRQARSVFSALQGALIVQRSSGDAAQLQDVVSEIRARLKPARK